MGLYIPTSGASQEVASGMALVRGQLYNLDLNEILGFQFNPETFSWDRDLNWAEISWKGAEKGGDLQYVNAGPITFDLDLVYLAEPHAPSIEHNCPENLTGDYGLPVDFEQVEALILRWMTPLENVGRPSRIKVILGDRSFLGVITTHSFEITDFFEDLTARHGRLSIGFREWQPQQAT
jgi:hypothetical protein